MPDSQHRVTRCNGSIDRRSMMGTSFSDLDHSDEGLVQAAVLIVVAIYTTPSMTVSLAGVTVWMTLSSFFQDATGAQGAREAWLRKVHAG